MTAGGMAGIFSWIFTYPQDVIKSRLQADGWGRGQQYQGALHCLRASVGFEGWSCLTRGVGSTVIRAFPMNAVTFGVYTYIMRRFSPQDEKEDTLENLMARIGVTDKPIKLESTQKMSTLATDGPNIIFVQEPLISPISQIRMYPEQMLWACPGAVEDDEKDQEILIQESFSNYCNFNQFTQRSPLNDLYNEPEVLPAPQQEQYQPPHHECHQGVACPSLLCDNHLQKERRKTQITTQDFLLPTNLLTNLKASERIYGFYYIVA